MDEKQPYEELEKRMRQLEADAVTGDLNLIETLPVGISITSPEGQVMHINAAGLRMFGYASREDFLKDPASDHYVHKEDRERFKSLHQQGLARDFETLFVRKDGTTFWGSVTSVSRPAHHGGIQYISIFEDISERKAATDRADHLDRVLRAIRNVNQLITRETDRDRLLQAACDSLIETRGYHNVWIALMDETGTLGMTAEAGVGADFMTLVSQMRRGDLSVCAQKALSEPGAVATSDPISACAGCPLTTIYGGRGAMTIRLAHEGKLYGILSASIPSRLVNDPEEQGLFQEVAGDIAFALGAMEDRDRRSAAEEALRRANRSLEDRLQTLLSPGRRPEDLKITEIMGLDTLKEINHVFSEVFDLTMLLTDADGNYITEPENLSEFCNVIRQTEKGLQRCEASDQMLAKQVRDATGPVITRCSNAGLIDAALPVKIGGTHMASWLVGQFCPPDLNEETVRQTALAIGADEHKLIAAYRKLKRRPIEHMENALKMLDVFTQEISICGLNNLKLARAMLEREQTAGQLRESQQQLLVAQKMEAIGTLAGGIAHDFNNILAAIMGYTQLAMMKLPKESQIRPDLDEVIHASRRARDLIQQILAFSRERDAEKGPIEMVPLVKETIKFLRSSLPSTIEIREKISDRVGTILANPTQIHQVIMNLCTNAAHAMQVRGGVLEVGLQNAELGTGIGEPAIGSEKCITASGRLNLAVKGYLKLTVRDTGCGITPEIMERIFDPYFTTKEKGVGTGLGLAVVHGIIESYGGKVTVCSEPEKGTTFHVCFPRVDETFQEEIRSEVSEALPTGTERILFIDDEPALANLGKQTLKILGYDVTTLTRSTEAFELVSEDPNRFDLVITDLTMPAMTGDRLAREILKVRPDMPIILCTGDAERISPQKAEAAGITVLLKKPLDMRDLAERVREALRPKSDLQ
jgi:PAS domain S-box-containing protein